MSTPNDISNVPAPGEYLAECPECHAQAIGREWDMEPPGHLHDMGTEEQTFYHYVRVEPKPKRGRPARLEPVE